MTRARLRRFKIGSRSVRLMLLLYTCLLGGFLIGLLLFFPRVSSIDSYTLRPSELLSLRASLLTAACCAVVLLSASLSIPLYGLFLFWLGVCAAVGVLYLSNAPDAAPLAVYLFLPRLSLLCFCTADLCCRPASRPVRYLIATMAVFSAQLFFAPQLLPHLIR